ncbi:MAG TPA: class I SAM-dependent methyltransferase [Rhodocyclaceae bacterium]|nr:class I SAM-dependent methyltransferase [Rhodocyclaceae bacterium]
MIAPSPWVGRFARHIPAGGEVLDLACGSGRHARLLAAAGHPVLAVDRGAAALASLAAVPGVTPLAADLEGADWPLAGRRFAGIVVTNYLWRPRLANVLELLAPGGVLIYETFMVGNERYGKPSNPDFLLRSQELLDLARSAGLTVLAYEEGYVDQPKPALRQAICARQA